MMKRRFTTITTILAGVLASNTAFFATQTIAKPGNAAYNAGN